MQPPTKRACPSHTVDRRRGPGRHEHERASGNAQARPKHAVPAIRAQLRRVPIAVEQHKFAGIARLGTKPFDVCAAGVRRRFNRCPGRARCHTAAERSAAARHVVPGRTEAHGEIIGTAVVFDPHRTWRTGGVGHRPLQCRVADVDQQRHRCDSARRSETSPTLIVRVPFSEASTSRPIVSTSTTRPLAVTWPSSTISTSSPRACSNAL